MNVESLKIKFFKSDSPDKLTEQVDIWLDSMNGKITVNEIKIRASGRYGYAWVMIIYEVIL